MTTYKLWELIKPEIKYTIYPNIAFYEVECSDQKPINDTIRAKTIEGAIKQVKKKYPGRFVEIIEDRTRK